MPSSLSPRPPIVLLLDEFGLFAAAIGILGQDDEAPHFAPAGKVEGPGLGRAALGPSLPDNPAE